MCISNSTIPSFLRWNCWIWHASHEIYMLQFLNHMLQFLNLKRFKNWSMWIFRGYPLLWNYAQTYVIFINFHATLRHFCQFSHSFAVFFHLFVVFSQSYSCLLGQLHIMTHLHKSILRAIELAFTIPQLMLLPFAFHKIVHNGFYIFVGVLLKLVISV